MVKGFTLPELMASLAILSIITALSAPHLSNIIERNKVEADILSIKSIIQSARNKAITSKNHITICGRYIENECSRDWSDLKVINPVKEEVIFEKSFSSEFSSVIWSAFQNKRGLTIAPTGYTDHQNGTLYLCYRGQKKLHRAVIVSKSGRVTIERNSSKLQRRCSKHT
ncbi:prepilin-type N-terminal cleavage/methylation domain-containing protein [Kangiella sp. HD9-110m-PIT-SAG07]|nr:prepilin-type N-terminal cleavage/methylation domain-containing protein [Kangiella sp. HD9-110m-PIT-SAG07]